jgi:hypothetical protein
MLMGGRVAPCTTICCVPAKSHCPVDEDCSKLWSMRPADDRSNDASTDRPGDRRVTVVEAAEILGITPDAVRSRLRRGTLRKDRGPDDEVLVVFDGDQSADQSTTDRTTVALVEVLQDQIDHLRHQLDQEREANRENRRLLALQLEHMRALEPPREPSPEPRESPVSDEEGPPYGTSPQEAEESLRAQPMREPGARVPWWRRWFGG